MISTVALKHVINAGNPDTFLTNVPTVRGRDAKDVANVVTLVTIVELFLEIKSV